MFASRNPDPTPVAIVVGAAGEYGTSVAHALSAHHRVLVVDAHGVTDLAFAIRAHGGDAEPLLIDISDPIALSSVGEFAEEHLGPARVYVHCPPPLDPAPTGWLETSVDVWDRTFEARVRSVWLACRAVVPILKANAPANIVLVGSDGSASGFGPVHEATATSALVGVVRSLAREVGDDNIGVNMISPGTGANRALEPSIDGSVTGDDVATAVLFLCSPDAEFITGQSWLVNGGSWLQ